MTNILKNALIHVVFIDSYMDYVHALCNVHSQFTSQVSWLIRSWCAELPMNEASDSERPPNTCSHVGTFKCS